MSAERGLAERIADIVRIMLGETLGAVAALQQERFAAGHLGEIGGQIARFPGKDERRIGGERIRRGVQRPCVRVGRQLPCLGLRPTVGSPGAHVILRADSDVPVGMGGDAVGCDLIDDRGIGALAVLLPALNGGTRGVVPRAERGPAEGPFLAEALDLDSGQGRHGRALTQRG
jgi:hypothetical protein